jgi:hypothetical protein
MAIASNEGNMQWPMAVLLFLQLCLSGLMKLPVCIASFRTLKNLGLNTDSTMQHLKTGQM